MARNNPSKALIIGNGFDLAHFLPTSYYDFITFVKILDEYEGDWSRVSFTEIFQEKTNAQEGFKADWLISVRKYYDTDKIHFDLSNIQGKINNAWLEYFKPIHTIETWIDFENEIGNALISVSEFIRKSDETILSGSTFRFLTPYPQGGESDIFFQREKLIKLAYLKLLNAQKRMTSDITSPESASHFEVISNFNRNGDVSGVVGLSTIKIIDHLFNELEQAISIFSCYLKNVVEVVAQNVRKSLLEDFPKFDEIYTFNYTKTVTNFYPNNQLSASYFLHGNLDSPDGTSIVLGVNEVNYDVLGIAALSFTKYFQTLYKETRSAFLDELECKTQYFQGVDYYVWGHSLDKSDEKYIKRLFQEISFELAESGEIVAGEYYINDTRRKIEMPISKITVYYHNKNSKARLLKNLLDMIGKDIIEKSIRTKHLQLLPSPKIWKD